MTLGPRLALCGLVSAAYNELTLLYTQLSNNLTTWLHAISSRSRPPARNRLKVAPDPNHTPGGMRGHSTGACWHQHGSRRGCVRVQVYCVAASCMRHQPPATTAPTVLCRVHIALLGMVHPYTRAAHATTSGTHPALSLAPATLLPLCRYLWAGRLSAHWAG